MFVLAELIGRPDTGKGVAIAFGPGLAAEGFHFERVTSGGCGEPLR
jgi:predicted naringenin-chalcone synthase